MLTFSYTHTNCSKFSLPCVQNDSRICAPAPRLSTSTATIPSLSPYLPHCLMPFLCLKPNGSSCSQMGLIVAHGCAHACVTSPTLPSNHAHMCAHTHTASLPPSPSLTLATNKLASPTQELLHFLFPPSATSFPQISIWLHPSLPSGPHSGITVSARQYCPPHLPVFPNPSPSGNRSAERFHI